VLPAAKVPVVLQCAFVEFVSTIVELFAVVAERLHLIGGERLKIAQDRQILVEKSAPRPESASVRCLMPAIGLVASEPLNAEAAKNQVPTMVAEIPDTGRLFITNRFLDDRIGDLASTEESVLLLQISESQPGHFESIRRLPN